MQFGAVKLFTAGTNMSIAEENTPAEKKQLKKYEKKYQKKICTKRYGKKEGAKIYYATLTKMAKEKVEEMYSSSGSRGHVRINLIKVVKSMPVVNDLNNKVYVM